MIRVGDVARIIERAAPLALALPDDNPGLQAGRADAGVGGVLVALDPTPAAVRRAVRAKADLLVTHHPLFMDPLRRIDTGTATGAAVAAAIGAGISVYAAHTNLDAAPEGLAVAVARRLGIEDSRFLHPVNGPAWVKVVVFVPVAAAAELHAAMAAAGAGSDRPLRLLRLPRRTARGSSARSPGRAPPSARRGSSSACPRFVSR